jgi:hypothetical protein
MQYRNSTMAVHAINGHSTVQYTELCVKLWSMQYYVCLLACGDAVLCRHAIQCNA